MMLMLFFMLLMMLLLVNEGFRTGLAEYADPILAPILPEEKWFVITVFFIGTASMLINTVLRNFFIDPIKQAHIGHRMSQVRRMMNEATLSRDPIRKDKAATLQQQLMPEQMEVQMGGMKPMMFTFIFIIAIFAWVGEVVSAGAHRLTASLGVIPPEKKIAGMIDHTLLKPDATPDQIAQLCYEARKYGFASVCVNPSHVSLCAELLKNAKVKVCTVIGFPLGATAPDVKAFEAGKAIDDGATEIDMVINIGALKSNDFESLVQGRNSRKPMLA